MMMTSLPTLMEGSTRKRGAAPHHAVHLPVIVPQREVDVPVVNAPRGDFALQGLMLEQRVALDRALDQLRKLTDGQRARRRLVAR